MAKKPASAKPRPRAGRVVADRSAASPDVDEARISLRRIWEHERIERQNMLSDVLSRESPDPDPGTPEDKRAVLGEISRAVLGDAQAARAAGQRLAAKVRAMMTESAAQAADVAEPDKGIVLALSSPFLVLNRMVLTAIRRVRSDRVGDWLGKSEAIEHGLLVLIAADPEFDPAAVGFDQCPPWKSPRAGAFSPLLGRESLDVGDSRGFWRMAREVRRLLGEHAAPTAGPNASQLLAMNLARLANTQDLAALVGAVAVARDRVGAQEDETAKLVEVINFENARQGARVLQHFDTVGPQEFCWALNTLVVAFREALESATVGLDAAAGVSRDRKMELGKCLRKARRVADGLSLVLTTPDAAGPRTVREELVALRPEMLSWSDEIVVAGTVARASSEFEVVEEKRRASLESVPAVMAPEEPASKGTANLTLAMTRPVLISDIAEVVGKRGDLLIKMLRTRKYPIGGPRGAYVADLAHIIATVPRRRKRLQDWADKHYPIE